jgi:hypothetical protein
MYFEMRKRKRLEEGEGEGEGEGERERERERGDQLVKVLKVVQLSQELTLILSSSFITFLYGLFSVL